MKNTIKEQKGSMAVYVTIVLLAFMLILSAIYMSAVATRKAQLGTILKVKESYEMDNNDIEDIYQTQMAKNYVPVTASIVHNNLKKYLGKSVDYNVIYTEDGQNEWEIFYADANHIYLITKGHLAEGGLSRLDYVGTSDFTEENIQNKFPAIKEGLLEKTYNPKASGTEEDPYLKYSSTRANMKTTLYLLDSTNWNDYANNEFANWAIGAPTYELFIKSYNAYYSDKSITLDNPKNAGYPNPLSTTGSIPMGTYLNYSTTKVTIKYWLACPSDSGADYIRIVNGGDTRVHTTYTINKGIVFRPIVCLDSNVKLVCNSIDEQYNLEWK